MNWVLNGGGAGGEEDVPPAPTPAPGLDGPEPLTWLTILLFFGHARNFYLIGKALAEKYPTAVAFEEARNDQELQGAADKYAQLLTLLRGRTIKEGVWDVVALQREGTEHYAEALRSIVKLAEKLGVEADTLLAAFASL